jgi:hypothetical protein
MARRPGGRAAALARLVVVAAGVLSAAEAHAQPRLVGREASDPRVGLKPGWSDAGQAIRNLELVAHRDRPQGFFNPAQMGDFAFANADLAFRGNLLFLGGYHGWQAWDISNPANPTVRKTLACPGGQGDVSVWGNLLFMSVEETRGRVDCALAPESRDTVSTDRFRGVRIFDIGNLDAPRQVAAVQTCRGSHTHTLVPDPRDPANVYVYVSGTSPVRPASELAGCSGGAPAEDPNTAYFRIEVIKVPVARPQEARVVNAPRIFADSAGNIAGLFRGGSQGQGAQSAAQTNQCHDITAYPEIGLAGGACAGNGILLDIRDPANPVRVEEVVDPNFAYWHSATFNNAGDKVLFTDEWGGGVAPRCRESDRPEWGADAIFTLRGRELRQVGYFKIPAAQTALENCVAHNGSLIPVPGRDIMVQAWYQGGISVFDWTDPAKPVEIAFFDRGPMTTDQPAIGGFWASYWYNGHIYASEIGRGLDVFRLAPSQHLSQNEIDAAKLVRMEQFNPQHQQKVTWPASFVVARAYVDQLERGRGLPAAQITRVRGDLRRAEQASGAARRTALTQLASRLDGQAASSSNAARVRMLAGAVRDLAGAR